MIEVINSTTQYRFDLSFEFQMNFIAQTSEYYWYRYRLDVLWRQPIKLIQVVSTSEFHEYWWNDIDFIFFIPSILLQGLRSLKHCLPSKPTTSFCWTYLEFFILLHFCISLYVLLLTYIFSFVFQKEADTVLWHCDNMFDSDREYFSV